MSYFDRKNKDGCGCRWCEGERPFKETETRNCGACGEFIYFAWDKVLNENGHIRHCWRNYVGDQPHECTMDYSHGKRLGKVWI